LFVMLRHEASKTIFLFYESYFFVGMTSFEFFVIPRHEASKTVFLF